MVRTTVVFQKLLPYAAAHRFYLRRGIAASLIAVIARLTLPWPLHVLAKRWSSDGLGPISATSGHVLDVPSSILALGVVFFLIVFVLGWADRSVRLAFTRFAIKLAGDLREDVFIAVTRASKTNKPLRVGDFVARLIADTERIKIAIRNLLVHSTINGMVFCGVITVMLVLNPALGFIMGCVGVGTIVLVYWGSRQNQKKALKYRRKEGKLANQIVLAFKKKAPEQARFVEFNETSGRVEAGIVNIQGLITWGTSILFALGVLLALLVGARQIELRQIEASEMVLFLFYTLILYPAITRLARQGTQIGNIVGTGHRLVYLLSVCKEEEEEEGAIDQALQNGALHPVREQE